tara:strand:+ start:889 stop:1413 length:525 start_codon:yes stop_codon:yes gene_type:complete
MSGSVGNSHLINLIILRTTCPTWVVGRTPRSREAILGKEIVPVVPDLSISGTKVSVVIHHVGVVVKTRNGLVLKWIWWNGKRWRSNKGGVIVVTDARSEDSAVARFGSVNILSTVNLHGIEMVNSSFRTHYILGTMNLGRVEMIDAVLVTGNVLVFLGLLAIAIGATAILALKE